MTELSIAYSIEAPSGLRVVVGNCDDARTDPDWIGYLDPESAITGLLDGPELRGNVQDRVAGDGAIVGPGWRGQRSGTVQGMISPNDTVPVVEELAAKLRRVMYEIVRADGLMRWTPSYDGVERRLRVRHVGRPDVRGRQPKTFLLALTSPDPVVLADSETSALLAVDEPEVVEHAGDADTWPRLRAVGPITAPLWTLGADRSVAMLDDLELAGGEYVDVYPDRGVALKGAATSLRLTPGVATIVDDTSDPYNSYGAFVEAPDGHRIYVGRQADGHNTTPSVLRQYDLDDDDAVLADTELDLRPASAGATNHIDCGLAVTGDLTVLVGVVNEGPAGGDAASRIVYAWNADPACDPAEWSEPELILDGLAGFDKRAEPGHGADVPWAFLSASPLVMPDGTLRLGIYGCSNDAGQVWYLRILKGTPGVAGVEWEDLGVEILLDAGAESAAEPNIIRLQDGRQYMTIRGGDLPGEAAEAGVERVWGVWTSDDWATHTDPVVVMDAANARPFVIQLPDGRVILTGRDPSTTAGQGWWAASYDGGLTYGPKQQLAAARERLVYASGLIRNGILELAVAQEVTGGADVYLYRLAEQTLPRPQDAYDDAMLALNPAAYWARPSGRVVEDLVGGLDATLIGDARPDGGGPGTLGGLRLEGTGFGGRKYAFAKRAHHADLDMVGDMTVIVWVKPTQITNVALVSKNFRFELSSSRLLFGQGDEVVFSNGVDAPNGIITAGEARMYAAVYIEATDKVRFFRDGDLFGDERTIAGGGLTGGLVANAAKLLYLGTAENGTAADPIGADLSRAAIVNSALTDLEISDLFDAADQTAPAEGIEDVSDLIDLDSTRWWQLPPGDSTVELSGTDPGDEAAGQITWRTAWP